MSEENNYEIVNSKDINVPTTYEPERISMPKMWEMAESLASSTVVPVEYRNRKENVFLALDLSNRMGISPMAIMSNMYVVNGRPSFSGSFMAGIIKSSPLFSDVELVWVGEEGSASWGCFVQAMETRTGRVLKGVTVTMGMAKAEGWLSNKKWQSMPELMLTYRAFSFFGRTHASELLSGIYDRDEMDDLRVKKGNMVNNPYQKE